MTVVSYFLPASVPEALQLLETHDSELLVIAGGTVAMPLINDGVSLPTRVMGLRRAGLDRITRTDEGVRIGATATLTSVLEQDVVPLLRDAARRTASWSIRNMGTVGGNLFTPPPGGDVATALLALDAVVELTGPAGSRHVPLEAFYTGFMTTALAPDELVTAVTVPIANGRHSFIKFGRKAANTPAIVTVAVQAMTDGDAVTSVRIAIGAAGPHPLRARRAEATQTGAALAPDVIAAAGEAALTDVEPFTDAVASAWYRQRMVPLLVRRALADIAGPAGRGE